ncbi:protein ABHD1 [Neocloeon triangulifer]|uniref:protein ABHD1 n=1 Tax=Neocloeon triangulifer TaxID=2078957 RepID=UPI00286FA73A|nr:protein ABHD1 [Neocloeon triangulifer]
MDWLTSTLPRSFDVFPEIPRWSMGLLLGTGFVTYYLYEAVKHPILACNRNSKFREFLENHVPIMREKFWPTVWCFESRLQTVFASVLRQHTLSDIVYRRQILPLKDGGELALDWLDPDDCSLKVPLVLVLPGLTGNSQAEYIKSLMLAARAQGFRCVVLNNRGLGGVDLKTPRTYCASNCEDLAEVIDHLREADCAQNTPFIVVGISMGGLMLGNYLAAYGEEARKKIDAGMIISVPWDVFKATESIEQFGLNRLLNYHLATSLVKTLERVKHHMPWDVEEALKSTTVRQFDSRFTCKQFGYTDVEEYYSAATLHTKLDRIRVPTLCLSAADDPFQPMDAIPVDAADKSEHVAILITARGGHIGFIDALKPGEDYMCRVFVQYVEAVTKKGRPEV